MGSNQHDKSIGECLLPTLQAMRDDIESWPESAVKQSRLADLDAMVEKRNDTQGVN